MTTAADDSAVEDAFEALLAGRYAPEGQAGLAAFTEAVRASATRPGRPDAALAELLATGLLTDQSSPSVRTARSAGSPPARRPSRVRTRRRTAMILPALIVKFLSAGAVAQAATGTGVVLVAVTGVGAVGALPAPAQDTFATVVAAVTPLEAPSSEVDTSEEPAPDAVPDGTLTEDVGTTEEIAGTPEAVEFDSQAWIDEGPVEGESFGAWVSQGANNVELRALLEAKGVTFGSVVSGWASSKGLGRAELAAQGVDLDALTEAPAEADADGEEVSGTEQADVAATTGARGSGNGGAGGASKAATSKPATGKATSSNAGNGNVGGGNGRGNG